MSRTNTVLIIVLIVLVLIFDGISLYRTHTAPSVSTPAPAPLATSTPSTPSSSLAIGQSLVYDGLTLTLNSIVQDSRCAVGVQCIQAGQVVAEISLKSSSASGTADMTTADQKGYVFGKYTIVLFAVSPDKTAGGTIASSDYRLTFTITSS